MLGWIVTVRPVTELFNPVLQVLTQGAKLLSLKYLDVKSLGMLRHGLRQISEADET